MRESDDIRHLDEIPGVAMFLSHAGGYGPGEICDVDGDVEYFEGDDACEVIAEGEGKLAVMCQHDFDLPQMIVFYLAGDGSGRIVDARRADATENNMELVRRHVADEDTSGMELESFPVGLTREQFDKQLGIG